jgi:hypothetical protein
MLRADFHRIPGVLALGPPPQPANDPLPELPELPEFEGDDAGGRNHAHTMDSARELDHAREMDHESSDRPFTREPEPAAQLGLF